ncbi:hypothetical protein SEPCBS119000_005256 [Sporothrix epigloea]|uniref:Protamine P1 n=1 Tax=Sporothrix epigloea TaxID=1892477 RepID=A0ABP0DWU1_9PEZI
MDDNAQTTSHLPTIRRPRWDRSPSNSFTLCGDFMYEEPLHNHDDVLLSGSDDEYYEKPDQRVRKLEEQARLYLQGRRPLLLSASLRGPFNRESGWKNPWIGRRNKTAEMGLSYFTRSKQAPVSTTPKASISGRTRSATQRGASTSAPSTINRSSDDLGTTADIFYDEKEPKVKKPVTDARWLRSRNLKRKRPNDDDDALSPTPIRKISTASLSEATNCRKISPVSFSISIPVFARSMSPAVIGPAAAVLADETIVESTVQRQPIHNAADSENCDSHISYGEEATPPRRGLESASSREIEQPHAAKVPINDAAVPIRSDAADLPENNSTAAAVFDHDAALLVEGNAASNASDFVSLHDADRPADGNKPDDNLQGRDDKVQQDLDTVTNTFEDGPVTVALNPVEDTDTGTEEARALPAPPDRCESENSRLATQLQSPWTKCPIGAFAARTGSILDGSVSPPSFQLSESMQSPWFKEKQPDLFDVDSTSKAECGPTEGPGVSLSKAPNTSLDQKSWADANLIAASSFLPKLPTSPCSPEKGTTTNLPAEKNDRDYDQSLPSFLPSLPIPIHAANSSVTAPSTPETKQSSLPTPDMTFSIKSFRRFRSTTPTPPPRQKNENPGGPRSILLQRRQGSSSGQTARRLDRRVRFDIPLQEETIDGEVCTGLETPARERTASSPPLKQALFDSLPSEVDRFKCHFAAMAERAVRQPTSMPSTPCSSSTQRPARSKTSTRPLDADNGMAELRQLSDTQSRGLPAKPQATQDDDDTSIKSAGACGGPDKENVAHDQITKPPHDGGRDDRPAPTAAEDDVQDVMDNLDEFLGLWDMDAELAQVRSMT